MKIEDTVILLDRTAEKPFRLQVPMFSVMPGEVVVLLGPSGTGKTTFLEFLACLRPAESTAIYDLNLPDAPPLNLARQMVTGDLDALAELRSGPVGYVAQAGALIPFLSAEENATVSLDLCGERTDRSLRQRFDKLVQSLELTAHLGKDRRQLSGGQRKRVALLRGLARPRALVLLDEPFAGLDAAMAAKALELILRIARDERTGFAVVTHDYVAAVERGAVVYRVEPDDQGATVLPGFAPQGGHA